MGIGDLLRDLVEAVQYIRAYEERLARLAEDVRDVVKEQREMDRRLTRLEAVVAWDKGGGNLPPASRSSS